jgi:hypothetical protein
MPNVDTIELKPFLPSKDFEVSQRFYQDLGFTMESLGPDLAYFSHGASKFLLQNFYIKTLAENFVVHLLVHDVDSWWEVANNVMAKYGTSLDVVRSQPWGLRDFTFLDPCGVLWRVGQAIA